MAPFRFRTEPYAHQLREFLEARNLEKRAMLWEPRTGKTKVIVDQAAYLWQGLSLDGLLVVAPNGVHRNWVKREIPAHCPVPWRGMAWSATRLHSPRTAKAFKGALSQLLRPDPDRLSVLAVGTEGLISDRVKAAIRRFLRAHPHSMVVFDESDDFRNAGSRRTKRARGIAKKFAYRRIMTGTVVENSPLNAFPQFELLGPGTLGFTRAEDFKREYSEWELRETRGGRRYPALQGYKNLEDLRDRMARHSSVVLRSDCPDLPPLIPFVRSFEMTNQQQEVYDAFVRDALDASVEDAATGAALLAKLLQVPRGFYYDGEGRHVDIPGRNPALAALRSEIEQERGKFIVWCRHTHEIELVRGLLDDMRLRYVSYYKRVSERDKDRAVDRFQGDPSIMGFVGQPQSASRGLTLDAATWVFWFSHTFDAVVRRQGSDRATGRNQAAIPVGDLVCAGSRDEYVMKCHENKESVADALSRDGLRAVLMEEFEV